MAEKLKPWERYRLKTTGQHCELCSYSEDGTVTICVDAPVVIQEGKIYVLTPEHNPKRGVLSTLKKHVGEIWVKPNPI